MNTDETKTENALATEPHGKHGIEEEELTFKIRGCVYEVFRVLGAGFLEQVYHQALLKEFELQGLRAESQWQTSWSPREFHTSQSGNPAFHFMTPSAISVCFRG
jgi:hypothetical protein